MLTLSLKGNDYKYTRNRLIMVFLQLSNYLQFKQHFVQDPLLSDRQHCPRA